ncbi:MAG: hypothetical protein AB1483_01255 [Candidatus Zixiibacteriota bacterium]
MHPNKDEIKQYILGELSNGGRQQIARHLETCEFCRELADDIRLEVSALRESEKRGIPMAAESMKKKLSWQAFGPKVITLRELHAASVLAGQLAADGKAAKPKLEHLKTLYCESPDVVLRLMRDTELSKDYLQVIAEDSSLYAHIMVDVPERELSVVTDEQGHAEIEPGMVDRAGDSAWQLHLPDAVFTLEALDFDPDKTIYEKETILTTENDDRIKITFEGKTVGKKFTIEILQLDGRPDFDPVRVVMMADGVVDTWRAGPQMGRKITLKDRARKIIFRLFHQ